MTAGRATHSARQDWGTPEKYARIVRAFFGGAIDLDPCSNEYSIVAARHEYQLPERDGLRESWRFSSIFVNPPYGVDRELGTSIRDWLRRCDAASREDGAEVLALIPVATNTSHWKEFVFTSAAGVCFLHDTRLRFLIRGRDGGQGAPMACAMVYWGEDYRRFSATFGDSGAVVDVRPLRGASSAGGRNSAAT